jgi:tetratricopeptide (TPR) repeat protein
VLTTPSPAPYNRFAMPLDDPALADAIRRQEERLHRDPGSLAFAQLADLYRKAGRTRDAVTLCRTGLVRYPHYTTARLILAKALASEGELDQALAETRAILEVAPKDVQAHRLAAELQRRAGRIDQAVLHLETAVKLDPGDRDSRSLLGLLRATTPPGDAESGLGRVLADDAFATVAFGTLCLDQGMLEEAAQTFTRILRKDPANGEARERLETTLRARQRRKG